MSAPSLTGSWVSLRPFEGDENFQKWAAWLREDEYTQGLEADSRKVFSPGQMKSWLENYLSGRAVFGVHLNGDDRLIGFYELEYFNWAARSCWVAIGIGEPEQRGKGLGREVMKLGLGYAFDTLNLNRVSLTVFEYNQRAVRSYLSCGFKEEGRGRQMLQRFGKRWDVIYMGILREEWLSK